MNSFTGFESKSSFAAFAPTAVNRSGVRVSFTCDARKFNKMKLMCCSSSAPDSTNWLAIMPLGTCPLRDRKSTRLNSSHVEISYAVFCLKKKKSNTPHPLSVQIKKHQHT